MLELDDILLHLLAHVGKYYIIMAFVFVCTQLAVKGFRDLAAILNLSVLMVLAEESLRIVRKGFDLIKNLLLSLDFLRAGTEFLESLHRVVVGVISWREEAT